MNPRVTFLKEVYKLIDRISRRKAYRDLDRFQSPSERGRSSEDRELRGDKLAAETFQSPSEQGRSSEALRALVSESAAEVLRRLGRPEGRLALMDVTAVPSSPRDREARRGYDGRQWFWGYKLGLISSRQGVILGVALIRANRVERHVTARLIRQARETLQRAFGEIPVKYLLADRGFAGETTYRQAHRYLRQGCRVVIPPRRQRKDPQTRKYPSRCEYKMRRYSPHRYRDWRFWKTPLAKKLYALRDEIERRLGQLTDEPFAIDRRPRGTVGVDRVGSYAAAKLVLWNFALYDNIVHGRPIHKVKVHVA